MTDSLDRRVSDIEQRNVRVESDKAWEGSWTRRVTIALITYLVVLAYGYALQVRYPYLNAIVPPVGFLLSTVTIPKVKQMWIKRHISSK